MLDSPVSPEQAHRPTSPHEDVLETHILNVGGMKCAGCIKAVEQALLQREGVVSATVNLVTEVAAVECQSGQVTAQDLADTLTETGFPTQPRNLSQGNQNPEEWAERQRQATRDQQRQVAIALLLLVLSTIGHLKHFGWVTIPVLSTISFHAGLATVALIGPGRDILIDGWQGLRRGAPNMNTLVGLGTLSAYVTSMVALILPQLHWECFFDEPVMLLSFILLGRTLERRARDRAADALRALVTLQPTLARLIPNPDAVEQTPAIQIPVEQVQAGDWLRILPGEKIPADGTLVSGHTTVDESMLTGESLPVPKQLEDDLVAGTLNCSGAIALRVTSTGQDTVLARLIDLVETAQTRSAPIQRFADVVSGYFTYGVLTLATLTFLFWYFIGVPHWPEVVDIALRSPMDHTAMSAVTGAMTGMGSEMGAGVHTSTTTLLVSLKLAIAVLVVACPCALGLATPTAILVGSGMGAERGLLIRGGDVLEAVHQLDTVVFDKTGTLTVGTPQVTDCRSLVEHWDATQVLQLAATVESGTQHPLALAVQQAAQGLDLPFADAFQTEVGLGVSAQVEWQEQTQTVFLGNADWLAQQQIVIPTAVQDEATELATAGKTVVYLAVEQQLVGLLAIADAIRPEAQKVVETLQKLGLQIHLLSGDRAETAIAVGQSLGLPDQQVMAEVKPEGKVAAIAQLQTEGHWVAMVGDGINDAPALAQAEVGIALNSGTEVAMETADIVLIRDRLTDVVQALDLSRATFNKIRQNLAWAFTYNLIGIPLAAGCLLPSMGIILSPATAGGLMAFSSVSVVLNSLLLRRRTVNTDL